MMSGNRKSSTINHQSSILRFLRDEGGQGIVFAAATLLLLVGFVALVYNIGRVVEGRTKMQLGADSAAYAGATVEGNSLSAIGWINSAMAQVYYNALKYAVDVNVSGVAAELERRLNGGSPGGRAYDAYILAYTTASKALPQAKRWMVDLSRIENAIAILTPRLMEEEMYAVAGEVGAERISVYPSFRMFPHADSSISYRIERLPNGWRITNIAGGNGDSLTVTLDSKTNTWDLQYTHDGLVNQEVQITQVSSTEWDIQYFQPPGTLIQEIRLVNTNGLGWVVWGSTGNPPSPVPSIQFTTVPVLDPTGATVQGTLVAQGGTSQVLWMGADGNLYACNWDSNLKSWTVALPALTSSQTTIGGVNVNVNVTNVIQFPGATANIGNPTTVTIGNAQIVLSNPPNISTWFGPVRISINGFTPDSFNISVGGFNLTPGDSDGQWRKYFNPIEELWWRNRLVVMGLDANNQPNLWQYDYQRLGALMTYDNPIAQAWPGRFVMHAFSDRGLGIGTGNCPPWVWIPNANPPTGWFDPTPTLTGQGPHDTSFSGETVAALIANDGQPPPGVYYQHAVGPGGIPIYVTIADLNLGSNPQSVAGALTPPLNRNTPWPMDYCLTAPMFTQTSGSDLYVDVNNSGQQLPAAGLPLVLAGDFFKYGINVGAWKSPVNPMLFPTPGSALNTQNAPFIFPTSTSQPPQTGTLSPTSQWWGSIAVASARVGIKNSVAPAEYVYNFDMTGYDADDPNSPRAQWCLTSPWNLYLADVNVKLLPSKWLSDEENSQINQCDLDMDILQGTPVAAFLKTESPTSYLWSAILSSSQSGSFQGNDWLNAFNGRADPRVGNALRNMQNRQGSVFDFSNSGIDQVVEH